MFLKRRCGNATVRRPPAQFGALIDNDRKRYAQIIRERKISVN